MKKLGKKINYFIRVFLAFGLFFTNVSSISVVFAYDGDLEEGNNKETEVQQVENDSEVKDEEDDGKKVETEGEDTEETLGESGVNAEETPMDGEEKTVEGEETTKIEGSENEEGKVAEGESENTETLVDGGEDTNVEEPSVSEEPTTEGETSVEYDYTAMLNQSASDLGLTSYSFREVDGEKKLLAVTGVNDSEITQIVDNAFDDVSCEIVEDQVILTRGDETVTYVVSVLNDEYLLEVVKTAVGNEEGEAPDGDLNGDGKVDEIDAVLLNKILNDGFDDYDIEETDTEITSRLDAYIDGAKVDSEVTVSTNDTFKVQYIVTLARDAIDAVMGTINYNKDLLSLEDVVVKNLTTGEVYEGKYLYFGNYISGTEKENEDGTVEYEEKDYVIIEMTFKALTSGSDTISIGDLGYYYETLHYAGDKTNDVMVLVLSSDASLSSLTVAGQEIELQDGVYEYEINVGDDVTSAEIVAALTDENGAEITSIVAPEELAEGENEVKITVTAEDGTSQTYTIKVIRGEVKEETTEETSESVVSPISYQEDTNNEEEPEIIDGDDDKDDKKTDDDDKKEETKDDGKLSRIIIISLILLALAGLIYLIFKDDDDEETKKANKDIDRLKKEDLSKENHSGNKNRKVDKNNKKGR